MIEQPVLVDRRADITIITINRPEARNAVDARVHEAVGDALEAADADCDVRAVIVTGAGNRTFCAGADLVALSRGERLVPNDPVKVAWGFAGLIRHPISTPVIAAVNGHALGGGLEITLACDLAVAVEDATFGLPEVKRGLFAAAAGVFRLPEQVPRKIAMELILTGDPISARRALELGLINAIAPRERLLDVALELAGRIAVNAPLSVQASKRLAQGIVEGVVPREESAWSQNRAESRLVFSSADSREGPKAFAEKRAPVWLAR